MYKRALLLCIWVGAISSTPGHALDVKKAVFCCDGICACRTKGKPFDPPQGRYNLSMCIEARNSVKALEEYDSECQAVCDEKHPGSAGKASRRDRDIPICNLFGPAPAPKPEVLEIPADRSENSSPSS